MTWILLLLVRATPKVQFTVILYEDYTWELDLVAVALRGRGDATTGYGVVLLPIMFPAASKLWK